MRRRFLTFLLPALLAIPAGPSCTGWPRGWTRAKNMSSPGALSGAWEGTWRSERTGHHGGLRCAVFPHQEKPNVWEYRYRASWARVLCAGFRVDCEAASQPGGTWLITGERDLGRFFGGVFTHRGVVAGDTLEARYQAAGDHGVLRLERVANRQATVSGAP